MMMENYKTFLKFVRNQQDYYDDLMAEKNDLDSPLTSKEFICLFYINALINDKIPIFKIAPRIPKEYHTLLKKTIRARLKADRVVVDWSALGNALTDATVYNFDVDDEEYRRLHYPYRL